MAEKIIVFSDQEQLHIQEVVIDQDKEAAFKFLTDLMHHIKSEPGHVCGPRAFK